MKRFAILAALLLTAAPAPAQLNIKKVGEKPKQLAVLQMKWAWLYSYGDKICYVSATTNQFDDWIWISLGDSYEEAAESVKQLIEAINDAGEDDILELQDMDGDPIFLKVYNLLGKRQGFSITKTGNAGEGYLYTPNLNKAAKVIEKEIQKK